MNLLWDKIKSKKVLVHSNGRFQEMTDNNRKSLFKSLRKQNFTLFPFHEINDSEKAIVISKFNSLTPTLNDISKSDFVKEMTKTYSQQKEAIRVFNIGPAISPYLRTLKEYRSIQFNTGSVEEIAEKIANDSYYQNQEHENKITNYYGNFSIVRTANSSSHSTNAPDHLMRLFTYNNLLRAVGKNYFNKNELAKILINEAKEANVVTPISSLIVLETQADYDRFDIKKSKNSLKNASIGNSGAVPEPHEWLLIIVVLGLLSYLQLKKYGLIKTV